MQFYFEIKFINIIGMQSPAPFYHASLSHNLQIQQLDLICTQLKSANNDSIYLQTLLQGLYVHLSDKIQNQLWSNLKAVFSVLVCLFEMNNQNVSSQQKLVELLQCNIIKIIQRILECKIVQKSVQNCNRKVFYSLKQIMKKLYKIFLMVCLKFGLCQAHLQVNKLKDKKYIEQLLERVLPKIYKYISIKKHKTDISEKTLRVCSKINHIIPFISQQSIQNMSDYPSNTHQFQQKINEYFDLIQAGNVSVQPSRNIHQITYFKVNTAYLQEKLIYPMNSEDFLNNQYLQNYILALINKGGGFLFIGMSKYKNLIHVKGLTNIANIKQRIKTAINYIYPQITSQEYHIDIIPIIEDSVESKQLNFSKEIFVVRLCVNVKKRRIHYCKYQGGKKYRLCIFDDKKIKMVQKLQIYQQTLKMFTLNKKTQNIKKLVLQLKSLQNFAIQSITNQDTDKTSNDPIKQFTEFCSLTFPISSSDKLLKIVENQLIHHNFKYNLIIPQLSIDSSKMRYIVLAFNGSFSDLYIMLKKINTNDEIKIKKLTKVIQFIKNEFHKQPQYHQLIQQIISQYKKNKKQFSNSQNKNNTIIAYKSFINLNSLPQKKLKVYPPSHMSNITGKQCIIYWETSSQNLSILLHGVCILDSSSFQRICYISHDDFRMAVQKQLVMKMQMIDLDKQ